MYHFEEMFLLKALRFLAHTTDAILRHFLPTCHPRDTINRITCHEPFMGRKNMGLRWWENKQIGVSEIVCDVSVRKCSLSAPPLFSR